ncbi:bifunctional glutathionylspermidine amidase/glutathionylspermidine synthetase [Achlya hypogyna]|uniref:Bifunctional glutathionylspermidine amidase/glutathionylspermidine synthetase n=1 Tax=Achlya hypogyna TaxID=1202772 RepID=A0A1V9ZGW1_ACHHY|nr:bifunctional glutathionylspermidine amidase/glutathionylspermidine synthetase [Achlya hypogyna]
MMSCQCISSSNQQPSKPKALLAKRPSKTVVCLRETALKLSEVEPAVVAKRPTQCACHNTVASDVQVHTVTVDHEQTNWLDATRSYVPVYQESVGAKLSPTPTASYFTLNEAGHCGLVAATETLHDMFVKATDYVLENEEELAPYFHIPNSLWPKIRTSWAKAKGDVVSGRFDFALTPDGIKVYEYNADSASCLLECGYTQDAWASAAGVGKVGRSSSSSLFAQLVAAWENKHLDGPLHVMCDNDLEERYHAMYMQSAAQAAGIECVLLIGLDGISVENDIFYDSDRRPIKNVWKTWCWRTVMNQVEAREAGTLPVAGVHLMDLLLHDDVRVFEPLWTLLAGSKAILPVLSKLYPSSPYLLRSSFEEKDVVSVGAGYVAKPVMGRTGSNIQLYSAKHELLNETGGRWVDDTIVYQELAMLPQYNGVFVQVNTWAIDGAFGGTVLRQDASSIIGLNSEIPALRIVPNATPEVVA